MSRTDICPAEAICVSGFTEHKAVLNGTYTNCGEKDGKPFYKFKGSSEGSSDTLKITIEWNIDKSHWYFVLHQGSKKIIIHHSLPVSTRPGADDVFTPDLVESLDWLGGLYLGSTDNIKVTSGACDGFVAPSVSPSPSVITEPPIEVTKCDGNICVSGIVGDSEAKRKHNGEYKPVRSSTTEVIEYKHVEHEHYKIIMKDAFSDASCGFQWEIQRKIGSAYTGQFLSDFVDPRKIGGTSRIDYSACDISKASEECPAYMEFTLAEGVTGYDGTNIVVSDGNCTPSVTPSPSPSVSPFPSVPPPSPLPDICVHGLINLMAVYNGTYKYDGDYNGKPSYKLELSDNSYSKIFWEGGKWYLASYISGNETRLYQSDSSCIYVNGINTNSGSSTANGYYKKSIEHNGNVSYRGPEGNNPGDVWRILYTAVLGGIHEYGWCIASTNQLVNTVIHAACSDSSAYSEPADGPDDVGGWTPNSENGYSGTVLVTKANVDHVFPYEVCEWSIHDPNNSSITESFGGLPEVTDCSYTADDPILGPPSPSPVPSVSPSPSPSVSPSPQPSQPPAPFNAVYREFCLSGPPAKTDGYSISGTYVQNGWNDVEFDSNGHWPTKGAIYHLPREAGGMTQWVHPGPPGLDYNHPDNTGIHTYGANGSWFWSKQPLYKVWYRIPQFISGPYPDPNFPGHNYHIKIYYDEESTNPGRWVVKLIRDLGGEVTLFLSEEKYLEAKDIVDMSGEEMQLNPVPIEPIPTDLSESSIEEHWEQFNTSFTEDGRLVISYCPCKLCVSGIIHDFTNDSSSANGIYVQDGIYGINDSIRWKGPKVIIGNGLGSTSEVFSPGETGYWYIRSGRAGTSSVWEIDLVNESGKSLRRAASASSAGDCPPINWSAWTNTAPFGDSYSGTVLVQSMPDGVTCPPSPLPPLPSPIIETKPSPSPNLPSPIPSPGITENLCISCLETPYGDRSSANGTYVKADDLLENRPVWFQYPVPENDGEKFDHFQGYRIRFYPKIEGSTGFLGLFNSPSVPARWAIEKVQHPWASESGMTSSSSGNFVAIAAGIGDVSHPAMIPSGNWRVNPDYLKGSLSISVGDCPPDKICVTGVYNNFKYDTNINGLYTQVGEVDDYGRFKYENETGLKLQFEYNYFDSYWALIDNKTVFKTDGVIISYSDSEGKYPDQKCNPGGNEVSLDQSWDCVKWNVDNPFGNISMEENGIRGNISILPHNWCGNLTPCTSPDTVIKKVCVDGILIGDTNKKSEINGQYSYAGIYNGKELYKRDHPFEDDRAYWIVYRTTTSLADGQSTTNLGQDFSLETTCSWNIFFGEKEAPPDSTGSRGLKAIAPVPCNSEGLSYPYNVHHTFWHLVPPPYHGNVKVWLSGANGYDDNCFKEGPTPPPEPIYETPSPTPASPSPSPIIVGYTSPSPTTIPNTEDDIIIVPSPSGACPVLCVKGFVTDYGTESMIDGTYHLWAMEVKSSESESGLKVFTDTGKAHLTRGVYRAVKPLNEKPVWDGSWAQTWFAIPLIAGEVVQEFYRWVDMFWDDDEGCWMIGIVQDPIVDYYKETSLVDGGGISQPETYVEVARAYVDVDCPADIPTSAWVQKKHNVNTQSISISRGVCEKHYVCVEGLTGTELLEQANGTYIQDGLDGSVKEDLDYWINGTGGLPMDESGKIITIPPNGGRIQYSGPIIEMDDGTKGCFTLEFNPAKGNSVVGQNCDNTVWTGGTTTKTLTYYWALYFNYADADYDSDNDVFSESSTNPDAPSTPGLPLFGDNTKKHIMAYSMRYGEKPNIPINKNTEGARDEADLHGWNYNARGPHPIPCTAGEAVGPLPTFKWTGPKRYSEGVICADPGFVYVSPSPPSTVSPSAWPLPSASPIPLASPAPELCVSGISTLDPIPNTRRLYGIFQCYTHSANGIYSQGESFLNGYPCWERTVPKNHTSLFEEGILTTYKIYWQPATDDSFGFLGVLSPGNPARYVIERTNSPSTIIALGDVGNYNVESVSWTPTSNINPASEISLSREDCPKHLICVSGLIWSEDNISGKLSPGNGTYTEEGIINDRPYYVHNTDNKWRIEFYEGFDDYWRLVYIDEFENVEEIAKFDGEGYYPWTPPNPKGLEIQWEDESEYKWNGVGLYAVSSETLSVTCAECLEITTSPSPSPEIIPDTCGVIGDPGICIKAKICRNTEASIGSWKKLLGRGSVQSNSFEEANVFGEYVLAYRAGGGVNLGFGLAGGYREEDFTVPATDSQGRGILSGGCYDLTISVTGRVWSEKIVSVTISSEDLGIEPHTNSRIFTDDVNLEQTDNDFEIGVGNETSESWSISDVEVYNSSNCISNKCIDTSPEPVVSPSPSVSPRPQLCVEGIQASGPGKNIIEAANGTYTEVTLPGFPPCPVMYTRSVTVDGVVRDYNIAMDDENWNVRFLEDGFNVGGGPGIPIAIFPVASGGDDCDADLTSQNTWVIKDNWNYPGSVLDGSIRQGGVYANISQGACPPASPTPTQPSFAPPECPCACYRFEQTILDSVGGHHLIDHYKPLAEKFFDDGFIVGESGSSFSLHAGGFWKNAYLEVPSSSVNSGCFDVSDNENLTICFWLKVSYPPNTDLVGNTPYYEGIVTRGGQSGDTGDFSGDWGIFYSPIESKQENTRYGSIYFVVGFDDDTFSSISVTVPIPDTYTGLFGATPEGAWNFYCFSIEPQSRKICGTLNTSVSGSYTWPEGKTPKHTEFERVLIGRNLLASASHVHGILGTEGYSKIYMDNLTFCKGELPDG